MYENYLKNLQKALKLIETPEIEVEEIHPDALKFENTDKMINIRSSIALLDTIPGVDLGQEAESKEVSFEEDTPIKQPEEAKIAQ